ncbi:hypothetical protein Hamer_G019526 [Homarus americanus]|uniref:Uncharacterized protein n=1 Tax=Homarus americanus TaxID=6706 RepID=A0A8J5IZ96_HOMAM|nr:hypothetical protein Hamer_G019526 [Homarus americanus]
MINKGTVGLMNTRVRRVSSLEKTDAVFEVTRPMAKTEKVTSLGWMGLRKPHETVDVIGRSDDRARNLIGSQFKIVGEGGI